ncbi:hypothetical protein Q7C36_022657 [Tachysurus vachellii]|uniref:Uncharacterized protein n=1 Tax=Tachysurus vachellii TaxID=175792 RepID=A0AA88IN74_TACVA|nr:hypothetical protein Q7C36_022657 [Tachysurus vachellii]
MSEQQPLERVRNTPRIRGQRRTLLASQRLFGYPYLRYNKNKAEGWPYISYQFKLIDMCSMSDSQAGSRAMEMSAFPNVPQQDYHRLSGLHYTSSFSDAEDCCDETTSTSSSSDYLGMDDC